MIRLVNVVSECFNQFRIIRTLGTSKMSLSYLRGIFHSYYTVLIELFCGKERIMEVYLNVAETGKGVFGVEATAQKYFDRSAAKLNTHQAVSIACVLPNPLKRNPKTVSQKNRTKYNIVSKRIRQTPYPFSK